MGRRRLTDNSTAVPNTQPDRLALVNALHGFLVANPAMEINARRRRRWSVGRGQGQPDAGRHGVAQVAAGAHRHFEPEADAQRRALVGLRLERARRRRDAFRADGVCGYFSINLAA